MRARQRERENKNSEKKKRERESGGKKNEKALTEDGTHNGLWGGEKELRYNIQWLLWGGKQVFTPTHKRREV
jgi:hypothetical protein